MNIEEEETYNEILNERYGIQESLLDSTRDFGNVLLDQLANIKEQSIERSQLRSITRSINKIAQESFSLQKQVLGTGKGVADLERKKIQLSEKVNQLEALKLKHLTHNNDLQKEIQFNIDGQIESATKLNQSVGGILDTSKEIKTSFSTNLFSGLEQFSKQAGLGIISSSFGEAMEASRVANVERIINSKTINPGKGVMGGLNVGGKTSTLPQISKAKFTSPLMAGIKALGPALKKALGPLALITMLVEGIMQGEEEVVKLQKSMALSSMEATSFRMGMMQAAGASGNINVTTSKLLKTFHALSEQFGFIAKFSGETLSTMTILTGVVGVSSKAAGNLAAAAVSTGGSMEAQYKNALGTSYELQRQEGVQFNLKDILEETGNITGSVRANLGANPAKIAEAVTQAKLFGSSLQEVAAAGRSLLDFESSITKELEAELLLGRNINLEKARLASLNGDQVTLAKELRREAGSFEEFSNMNVLQQEAIAAAVGMQSDALSDILFKQDIQGKSAKELRAIGKDDLADRLEAQTSTDKLAAATEKMKNMFADLGSALAPVLMIFGKILSIVGVIAGFTQDLIGGVASLFGLNDSFKFGESAGVEATKSLFNVGDMNSAADGKTQISTKEGGLFQFSPNDDIVAAPGLSDYLNRVENVNINQQPQSSTPTVIQQTSDSSLAKETNSILRQMLNKQGDVRLDSTALGTAMSVNSFNIQ